MKTGTTESYRWAPCNPEPESPEEREFHRQLARQRQEREYEQRMQSADRIKTFIGRFSITQLADLLDEMATQHGNSGVRGTWPWMAHNQADDLRRQIRRAAETIVALGNEAEVRDV